MNRAHMPFPPPQAAKCDIPQMNQNKLPSRVVDPRVISSGHDFTPAFVDFGRQMVGGRVAPLINLGAQEPPTRKIFTSLYVHESVHLKKSGNAWKPGMKRVSFPAEPESHITQDLFKKVRSILNKVTPEKFIQLMEQVWDLTIDTEERLKGVVDLVFEKAIDEPSFSVTYGNMCSCLATLKVPTTGHPNNTVNFRQLLLSRCQREFEKDKVDDVAFETKLKELDSAASTERDRLQVELKEALDITRRHSIGNIKFIGELFKLKMLNETIMHDCVAKLLQNYDEVSLECLCRLLTTIGKDLDSDEAKPRMDHYFKCMESIAKASQTPSRIRFMLQDTKDLRLQNWVPRRADQGPKTIEQIHEEAEIEEQEEQRIVMQQLFSKDTKREPDPKEQEDELAQGEETWNIYDPSKMLKFCKPRMDGNTSQVTWVKGCSGGAKAIDSDEEPEVQSVGERSSSPGLVTPEAPVERPEAQSTPPTSEVELHLPSSQCRTGRKSRKARKRSNKPRISSLTSSLPDPFTSGNSSEELLERPTPQSVTQDPAPEPETSRAPEPDEEPEVQAVGERSSSPGLVQPEAPVERPEAQSTPPTSEVELHLPSSQCRTGRKSRKARKRSNKPRISSLTSSLPDPFTSGNSSEELLERPTPQSVTQDPAPEPETSRAPEPDEEPEVQAVGERSSSPGLVQPEAPVERPEAQSTPPTSEPELHLHSTLSTPINLPLRESRTELETAAHEPSLMPPAALQPQTSSPADREVSSETVASDMRPQVPTPPQTPDSDSRKTLESQCRTGRKSRKAMKRSNKARITSTRSSLPDPFTSGNSSEELLETPTPQSVTQDPAPEPETSRAPEPDEEPEVQPVGERSSSPGLVMPEAPVERPEAQSTPPTSEPELHLHSTLSTPINLPLRESRTELETAAHEPSLMPPAALQPQTSSPADREVSSEAVASDMRPQVPTPPQTLDSDSRKTLESQCRTGRKSRKARKRSNKPRISSLTSSLPDPFTSGNSSEELLERPTPQSVTQDPAPEPETSRAPEPDEEPEVQAVGERSSSPGLVQPEAPVERPEAQSTPPTSEPELHLHSTLSTPINLPLRESRTELETAAHEPSLMPPAALQPQTSSPADREVSSETVASDMRPQVPTPPQTPDSDSRKTLESQCRTGRKSRKAMKRSNKARITSTRSSLPDPFTSGNSSEELLETPTPQSVTQDPAPEPETSRAPEPDEEPEVQPVGERSSSPGLVMPEAPVERPEAQSTPPTSEPELHLHSTLSTPINLPLRESRTELETAAHEPSLMPPAALQPQTSSPADREVSSEAVASDMRPQVPTPPQTLDSDSRKTLESQCRTGRKSRKSRKRSNKPRISSPTSSLPDPFTSGNSSEELLETPTPQSVAQDPAPEPETSRAPEPVKPEPVVEMTEKPPRSAEMIKRKSILEEFLLMNNSKSDACSSEATVSERSCSPGELTHQMERLMLEDMASGKKVFNCVKEKPVRPQLSSSPYLRDLMTAVCKAAAKENTNCRVHSALIQKRMPLYLTYRDSESERRRHALKELQALIIALDQPPNLLRIFFECLKDQDVISLDASCKWGTSEDPTGQLGAGVALKTVTAFFTWLREAESEDN